MKTPKIGLQTLARVSIDKNVYLFSDVRDFVWKTPNSALRRRLDFVVRKKDLMGCDLYLDRFGRRNLAGHIILQFRFSSGESLALSVEARLPQGEKYSFWKGLLMLYPIVAIRGTPEDILGLRKIRGENLAHYSLRIPKRQLQHFFESVLRETDYINSHVVKYHLLFNTCTSWLWRVVAETFGLDFWQWQVFLPGYIDRLLYKLGLISRKDYRDPELIKAK